MHMVDARPMPTTGWLSASNSLGAISPWCREAHKFDHCELTE
jgi:hypothetical protein